ncbi:MAG: chloride channel protein [Flammeovirgaceae bacterium]|nr:chloride channel protein [Flammeovirgaceae bacterium]
MIAQLHGIVRRLVNVIHRRLSDHQFFILSSILVGLSSGFAAIALKYFVHAIGTRVSYYSTNYQEFFLFSLFPLIGIAVTVLFCRYIFKNPLKKGSAEIVYSIAKKSSVLPSEHMYSHLVTSALTVGFGGSTGLESPIVSAGSAIGSNYARTYHLSYKQRTILLACGAAAGIAAVFNSPIAGVLFAIEVLLTEITLSAFTPLIISAACGALLSKIILDEDVILSFSLQQPFDYHNIFFYILLGVLAGLVSLYYARTFTYIERRIEPIKNPLIKIALGGFILSILLILFPTLFGEGYESIKLLSQLKPDELFKNSILLPLLSSQTALIIFLGALVFLKVIAAAITLASGGNGGNFGPSLFTGAYLGFVFARVINLSGVSQIPEANFTLVAMAGILSGVFYAPLTSIFLIAEITGGYELIIPLMIVSAISYTVVRYFEPLSMEAKKLNVKMKLSVEDRDKYLLSKLDLNQLLETNFSTVQETDSLRMLVKVISTSKRNTFPVINEKGELTGLIYLDDIRDVIFKSELYDSVKVKDLKTKPDAIIHYSLSLHEILKMFDKTNQWNLPVVENNQYKGFVSKSSILSKYREELLKSV